MNKPFSSLITAIALGTLVFVVTACSSPAAASGTGRRRRPCRAESSVSHRRHHW